MTIMNARRRPSPLVIAVEQMTFFRRDARAACEGEDPEMWFSEAPARVTKAKSICHSCPLFFGCTPWAIEHREHGTWGGLTDKDRDRRYHRRKAAA